MDKYHLFDFCHNLFFVEGASKCDKDHLLLVFILICVAM